MRARRALCLGRITVVAGETIEGELQYDFAGASRPCTFAFDIFKAFEKAANIEQQAGEFRTNGVKRVMHPLSRGNHCLGEHRRLFVPAAAAAGR